MTSEDDLEDLLNDENSEIDGISKHYKKRFEMLGYSKTKVKNIIECLVYRGGKYGYTLSSLLEHTIIPQDVIENYLSDLVHEKRLIKTIKDDPFFDKYVGTSFVKRLYYLILYPLPGKCLKNAYWYDMGIEPPRFF